MPDERPTIEAQELADQLSVVTDYAKKLEARLEQQGAKLFIAEQSCPALQNKITQMEIENMRLHAELMARDGERVDEESEAMNVVRDLSFMCAELRKRNHALEAENVALRKAASYNYEKHGIVLPSGHEVKWHGRKERMEAEKPVEPLATGGDASLMPAWSPPAEPARLVAAAEAQLTALLRRVQVLEAHAHTLQGELAHARAQVIARDEELSRLSAPLASAAAKVQVPTAATQHIAIGQLNSQVDFLNERCMQLEAALSSESAFSREASRALGDASKHFDANAELRAEKAALQRELRHAAGVVSALGSSLV